MWTKRSTLRGERMTNEPTQPLPESVRKAITSEELARTLINYLVENDGEDSIEMMVAGIQCIYLDALAAPIQELLNAAEEAACITVADALRANREARGNYSSNWEQGFNDGLKWSEDEAVLLSKHNSLPSLIAAAESRGRNAGLEEAAKRLKYYGLSANLVREIRALKTSAPTQPKTDSPLRDQQKST